MDRRDEALLKKLLPVFRAEAQEHLKVISTGLISIEKGDPEEQGEIIETIYRESHSLKGAARVVNLQDIVTICQSMENIFSALKRKEITPSLRMLDLLHQTVDCTSKLTEGEEFSSSEKSHIRKLIDELDNTTQKQEYRVPDGDERRDVKPATFSPTVPAPASTGTIRVSGERLDALLLQAEELLSIKLALGQRVAEVRDLGKLFDLWKKERARRRSYGADRRQETLGEAIDKDDINPFMASLEATLTRLIKAAQYDERSFGMMVDTLLDDMKKTSMLPFSSLLEIFPKFVRDLSRHAGKEVELTIDGGEIQIDRRVLEEIKNPLIHLVRNCIDHGIEMPDERRMKMKPPRGRIQIAISSQGSQIEIAVSDDGAGIDVLRVRTAAERCGSISREEASRLGRDESLMLIFRSGVTTSPIITDVSGRGLGLTIVNEKVEKLNGTVSIHTQPDNGTTFSMLVPLTLATSRGVLIRVGELLFVLPSTNVERVLRIKTEEVKTVENRGTLSLDGQVISLVRLGEVLELGSNGRLIEPNDSFLQIVVLALGEKRMAFVTDEILHEQEILVKPLGRQLRRVRNIAGATVLGSGRVVPILNVSDLMRSAPRIASVPAGSTFEKPPKMPSVLVVEDSITARTLLKTILESAGYKVKTSVDGIDAFAALKAQNFDMVVSDVDIPRMNGFDLTARIRADVKLSKLPVVLVTALGSREDRERGIDVGANAYIVKSSFDQSDLLEAVRRLI